MELEKVCDVFLVLFISFCGVPSLATVVTAKPNFTIDQFIQPTNFLPNLSLGYNNNNNALLKIAVDVRKMISHTNSSGYKQTSTPESTQTLPVFIYNTENLEDNLFKKTFVVGLGVVVFVLGCYILYRRTASYPRIGLNESLYKINRVETSSTPPPYILFAPPSYEEWVCGFVGSDGKKKSDSIIDIEWPLTEPTSVTTPTVTITTISDRIIKDNSVSEKLIVNGSKCLEGM